MKSNRIGRKKWILLSLAITMLIAGLVGCSEFNSPSSSTESSTFMAPDNGHRGDGTLDGGGRGGGGGGNRELGSDSLGLLPPECATATIGSLGGVLYLGQHLLIVPANAVRRNTTFQICINPESEIGVDLYPEGINFREPVWLWMSYYGTSYDDGPGGIDPANLAIFYVPNNGGQHEEQISTVNIGSLIVGAELNHFSRYIVGQRIR